MTAKTDRAFWRPWPIIKWRARERIHSIVKGIERTARMIWTQVEGTFPAGLVERMRPVAAFTALKWFRLLLRFGLVSPLSWWEDETSETDAPLSGAPNKSVAAGPFASTDHPVLLELRRRAVEDLFVWIGLDFVPPQFWRFLDGTPDPGQALVRFIQNIGCDPDAVRAAEPDASERFKSVCELLIDLVAAEEVLDEAAWTQIQAALYWGNLDRAKTLAHRLTAVSTILRDHRSVEGLKKIQKFEAFVAEVRKYALRPLDLSETNAERKVRESDTYTKQVRRYQNISNQIDAVISELHDRLIDAFDTSDFAQRDRMIHLREEIDEKLQGDPSAEVERLLADLASILADAEELLRKVTDAYEDRGGDKADAPGADTATRSELDQALMFFGFEPHETPAWEEINQRWRKFMSENHPDHSTNPADREEATERCKAANHHRDVLKRRFTM